MSSKDLTSEELALELGAVHLLEALHRKVDLMNETIERIQRMLDKEVLDLQAALTEQNVVNAATLALIQQLATQDITSAENSAAIANVATQIRANNAALSAALAANTTQPAPVQAPEPDPIAG